MNVYAMFDKISFKTLQDIKDIQKPLRITKGNNSHRIAPSTYYQYLYLSCRYEGVCTRFGDIPSMTLQDI